MIKKILSSNKSRSGLSGEIFTASWVESSSVVSPLSYSYSVATQSSQRRHVRVSKVQLKALRMALLDKFFRLHLLLALASAQWWGLQRGFRPKLPAADISPLRRFGAQRGIGVAKQPAAGYFRASSSNFFRVSQLFDSCPCNNFTCLY